MTAPRALARAAIVAASVFAADQATKALVRGDLLLGERRELAGPLKLTRVNNEGVAFGAFAGGGAVLLVIVVLVAAALVVYLVRHAGQPLNWLACGLILGGALGNAVDRVAAGAVTDFIALPHWPAFNVADIAISGGVILLMVLLLRADRPDAAT